MSVNSLLFFNKLFKLPMHPFNMQNDGVVSYSMWQYNKGIETIKFYLQHTDTDNMFKNKDVLDIGCGAAGKSLYYLSLGAKSVTGIDVVEKYEEEAYSLGYVERNTVVERYFDFEKFGEDLLEDECFHQLDDGRVVYLNC